MVWKNYGQVGIGNVGSYLVAGYPYITGSTIPGGHPNNGEIRVQFPRVAKNITIVNKSTSGYDILLHFVSRESTDVITQHHYLTLDSADDAWSFNVKCKEVYLSMSDSSQTGSFELLAELTSIDRGEMYDLSGSGVNSQVPF